MHRKPDLGDQGDLPSVLKDFLGVSVVLIESRLRRTKILTMKCGGCDLSFWSVTQAETNVGSTFKVTLFEMCNPNPHALLCSLQILQGVLSGRGARVLVLSEMDGSLECFPRLLGVTGGACSAPMNPRSCISLV